MKEVNYKININTEDANKGLKQTEASIDAIPKSIKAAEQGTDKLNKGLTKTNKVAGVVKGGINKIGLAFKAAGIGLIISAFAKLTELFSTNQRVMDAFNVVGETTAIIFNQLFNAIFNTAETLGQTNGSFNATLKILKALMTFGLTPLIGSLLTFKIGVQAAQLAWEKSVFGSGDTKTIKELELGLVKTAAQLTKLGANVLQAGSDIVEYGVEAAGEITDFTMATIDAVSKVSLKSSFEQAKLNVELKKQAEIARVTQQGLVEQYDRQAEQLRQIRDEERNTIDERIEANNKLKEVLDEQKVEMLKQVDLQIRQAQAQYNVNKSQENLIALLEAKNEKKAVEAQIEGFLSEQKTNDLALSKEKLELEKSLTDAATERKITELNANAELIKNDEDRINQQLKNLEEEKRIQEERLTAQRDSYKADTQAFIDAQIELDNFKLDAAIREKQLRQELSDFIIEKAKEEREEEIKTVEARLNLATQAANSVQSLGDAVFAHKMKNLEKGSAEEEEMARKQFKFNKALQLGMAIIDAGKAITASLAQSPIAIGPVPNPAGIASLAFAAATSAANIATIAAQQFQGGDTTAPSSVTGAGGGATGIGSQAPAFNVVGQSGFNQVAQALGQQNSTPVKAFVVSGDVTTAQALENNIIDTATF
jgi:uncharacterized membrane protein|tara:strand:- start:860 stop:2818 length:1959 start_codon:yes stop_codon:yes gene_type:complete